MDECGMHDVRNYKNDPMMRFVMNDVLYTFGLLRKDDGLFRFVLWVIDRCYLSLSFFACVCA